MGIKKVKPITPGMRGMSYLVYDVAKKKPEKSLLAKHKSSGGRNNLGRMTVRRRGGGAKRRLRIVDFKREKLNVPAKVAAIEYDPNRSANIALLHYADGEKRYIVAPLGLKEGDKVIAGEGIKPITGNCMPLRDIPLGTEIHNIEMRPGKGAQLVRAAGASAQLLAKEGKYASIKLPSGEVRLIHLDCKATIGQVGNIDWENLSLGKAGRARHRGIRPHTRGVAMNPVDHPMGGGEGKTAGGRHPCTPWGKPTKGLRTRKKHKLSDKYIIKRRKE
jgi:large subunit ribosomal protein L2